MDLGTCGGQAAELASGRTASLYPFLSKMKVCWVRGTSIFFMTPHLLLNAAAKGKCFFSLPTSLSCLPLPELTFAPLTPSLLASPCASFPRGTLGHGSRSTLRSGTSSPREAFPELSRVHQCSSFVMCWPYFKHRIGCYFCHWPLPQVTSTMRLGTVP